MTQIKKLLPAVAAFLLFITGSRLLWLQYLSTWDYPDAREAADGALDLSGLELNDSRTLELNGEWLFYPGVLLMEETGGAAGVASLPSAATIRVPKMWYESDVPDAEGLRYGSYRLTILLGEESAQTLR